MTLLQKMIPVAISRSASIYAKKAILKRLANAILEF